MVGIEKLQKNLAEMVYSEDFGLDWIGKMGFMAMARVW